MEKNKKAALVVGGLVTGLAVVLAKTAAAKRAPTAPEVPAPEIPSTPPNFLSLRYANPKLSSSTHAMFVVTDLATWTRTPEYTREPIGTVRQFPAITGKSILLECSEARNISFDEWWYGPIAFELPQIGDYTFDAKNERLDGIQGLNLTTGNNRCTFTGTVTGYSETDDKHYIIIEKAEDIAGYVNSGKYFIGRTMLVKLPAWFFVGDKVIGTLSVVKVALGPETSPGSGIGQYGYTYGFDILDAVLASVYDWPSGAYSFTGQKWAVEDVVRTYDSAGNVVNGFLATTSVHWRINSQYGLSRFSAVIRLTDPNGEKYFQQFNNYINGTEKRFAYWPLYGPGGATESGWPTGPVYEPYWPVALWANPDPGAAFYNESIAPHRGWVRVV